MPDKKLIARIQMLMKRGNVTQSQLADKLHFSQAAISQWLKGKKTPTNENIAQIADFFKVSPQWLHFAAGEGPEPDFDKLREQYREFRGWQFRPAPADGGRDYGNANVWAFQPNIWTMVRDIIQNSQDQALPGVKVTVTFRVIRLKGADLKNFKSALEWEGLLPHLKASAEIDQRLGHFIKHNLEEFEKCDELLLLAVEDSGTTGLLGDEFGTGNFAALCRNNLDSDKQKSGTAGGAFGLGKAVLWRVSQFSLVLFGSHLSKATSDGKQAFRIFGRCDLPWHQIGSDDDGQFAGPGWFGRLAKGRAVSYWDNEALASDLHLNRGPSSTGTSIVVVGFHDPSDDADSDPIELSEKIQRAVGDWFWPDMTNDQLQVVVETYEGSKKTSSAEIAAEKWRPEFVDAIQKWKAGDLMEQLVQEGDVVCRRVALKVPKRIADPVHPAAVQEAVLLVRRAADDSKSDRLSELALFRGVGMVVEYQSLKGICLGALPFHAALLCGEAAGNTPECLMADRFLRTSEPPAHEKWTSTPDLKTEYVKGGKSAIDKFLMEVKGCIREVVRPSMKDLSDGPNALKELLKIGEPLVVDDRPKITRSTGTIDADGAWTVDARIRVPRGENSWSVEPVVVFQQESGGGKPVRWRRLDAHTNCEAHDGRIIIPPNTNEARFTGSTDPESHPIAARESSVVIDARKFEKIEGGQQ